MDTSGLITADGPRHGADSGVSLEAMIRSTPALAALLDRDARDVIHKRTYHEALDLMLALWEEARALNPDIGADWRHDVECDIRVARALNHANARP